MSRPHRARGQGCTGSGDGAERGRPGAGVGPPPASPPPVPAGDRTPPRDTAQLSPQRRGIGRESHFSKARASHDIYFYFIIKKYRIQMGR